MKHHANLSVEHFCEPDQYIEIEYRCNSPFPEEEDILFGYATWNGEELISNDGDNYYSRDRVYAHEWIDSHHLTVWIEVKWSND